MNNRPLRAPLGRPPIRGARMTETVAFLTDSATKRLIEKAAVAAGVSVGAYCRRCVLATITK